MTNSRRSDPANSPAWSQVVARLIRSQMARSGISYPELSRRLADEFGTVQLENNLRSKVSRGTLGAQLLLQILLVCEPARVDASEVRELLNAILMQSKKSD